MAAGLNYNTIKDIDAGGLTKDNSTGFHFGAFLNLGGESLSVRPGVFYHRIGRYDVPAEEDLVLSAVEIPLDFRLSIAPEGLIDGYLVAGPVMTFPRCPDFDQAVETWQLTADVGGGVDLDVPGLGIRIQPELRYSIGVTDFLEESFTIGDVTVMPDDDERRISKLMLRLNVVL